MQYNELAKTVHYIPIGDGRDAYIYKNNGGISKYAYPFNFKEESRVTRRMFYPGSPSLGAKALKYKSNGTGRDTYIGFNDGGLTSPYGKYSFYSTLRKSTPSGSFSLFKVQTSWQHIKKNKEALSQKEAILRLSTPKYLKKL